MVAATFQAMTPAAPPTTEATTTSQGIPFSFQNVSFVIPEGLATGASGEVIPNVSESADMPWWEIAPEHTRIVLSGYNDSLAKFSMIEINVYPAQDYKSGAESIQKLQAILAIPTAPLTRESVPTIIVNAGLMMAAQAQRINFVSGSGVRMIVQYGQAAGPVDNNGSFYNFAGLTSDGKYYIVAALPTGAPFLQYDMNATPPQPADAIPFSFESIDPAYYESYYKAVEDKLNSTSADTFVPSLNTLDSFIQSITIQ